MIASIALLGLAITPTQGDSTWGSLRLLNSYRLFVALVVLCAFLLSAPGIEFGRDAPIVFYLFASGYFVAGLVLALLLGQRRPGARSQAYLQFYTDIVALAGITYSSGGVDSGLGMLLIVPVAGASLLLPPRAALVYPALATLFLLTGEAVRHLQLNPMATNYPQAALVGAVLFTVALVAALAARGRAQTAELARQRSLDVRRLAQLNERIIQQMESGILVVDHHGTITLANSSAQQLLGRPAEELAGHRLSDAAPGLADALGQWQSAPPAANEPVRPSPATEVEVQPQLTDLGDQGTLIALEDAGFIQEQLRQLKLASLGRLTASIAHEIRNPLAAIQQSAQLLAESTGQTHETRRLIEIQLEHCRRVNGIVANVLELSRQRKGPAPQIELVDWLAHFAASFRAEQGLAAERLRVHTDATDLRVRFDGEHLRQVVTNLCHNSFEHGRPLDRDSGLRVSLEQTRRANGQAQLDIKDNGVPIESDTANALFEPFFSTSEGGTGLGLFLARELCDANGAHLRYIHDDTGNRFRVQFDTIGAEAA
jgi:two-component system sensor histidine kinase PilS (NtrC family)